jgi:hypothetical protein
MTPKQKAKEIANKFYYYVESISGSQQQENAKQCALIAVDLRLEGDFIFSSIEYGQDSLEYWQEVKEEINKF